MGTETITMRQVPAQLKCRLQQTRSSTVAFLFAFGYDSLGDVDRAHNDLEMYRRMRHALDKSELLPHHRDLLHGPKAQYGTEDKAVLMDTSDFESNCVMWRGALEVLSG